MKKLYLNEKDYIILSEKQPSLTEELAVRQRVDFYSIVGYLPNPDPVLKKQGKDITVYEELLSDARVGGCAGSRKAGVKSLEWDIDRGKAKSRQAKLIKDVFNNLDIYQIISSALDAVLFGYAVLEVVWEKAGSYILPKKVEGKPQEWFMFDSTNRLLLRTKDRFFEGEIVPDYKFILIQHNATYKNPYGFPELSRCFWPVTFKRGGLKFWVMFTEKYGMPFMVGKHPRGTSKEETDKLADILEQMIQDAVAVIPDDASIEIMEAGGKSASAGIYRELLDYCDNEITIALLGQNLTTQVSGGSYAAAQTHMQIRKDLIDSDRIMIEKAINQLIRWIYEINFSDGEMPQFTMYEQEDIDKDLAERDEKLTTSLEKSGLKLTRKYYQKNYSLEDEDIIETAPIETPFTTHHSPLEHAESAKTPFPDQQALDSAVDDISPEELQEQIEGVLKPIIDLIKEGNSYDEIMEKLIEAYPDMDQSQVEQMLARAIFVAELWGKLNAARN